MDIRVFDMLLTNSQGVTSMMDLSETEEFTLTFSIPLTKILDVTKLKAFVDDKLTFAKMTISLLDMVGNTVGKGENVVYSFL